MTYSELEFIDKKVESLVNYVLDAVREKSFSNYVLLLARGSYQVEAENTFLSPYVVSSHQEKYLDRSREKFLVDYLNTYERVLKNSVSLGNDYKEYDLNVQMMIYAQIWESHQFLKTLIRIAGILSRNTYMWRIQFEELKKGKMKPIPKGKIIKEQIIEKLDKSNHDFAEVIKKIYDGDLRNDFAHASYYISLEDNAIISMDSELYSVKKKKNLFEWEQMFIYSALLSYYLLHVINKRRNSFKKDFPEIGFVEIEWPSYKKSGKKSSVQIIPMESEWGIDFTFRPY